MPQIFESSPQLLMVAGMAIIIWILWRRSSRYFGRGGRAHEPPPRPSALEKSRDAALSDAPREVTRWQVEMHELTRDLKGEIDAKLAVLQHLILQAERAKRDLAAHIAEAERRGLTGDRDPLEKIERWREEATEAAGSVEKTDDPSAPRQPLTGQIYALADAGAPPSAIADQTGLSLGDVEIALSLRARR